MADPSQGSQVVFEITDSEVNGDTVLRIVLAYVRISRHLSDETSPLFDKREEAGLDRRHCKLERHVLVRSIENRIRGKPGYFAAILIVKSF